MLRKSFIYIGILLVSQINAQIIVIDPGHNYDDITSGYKSETEVLTNWEVANLLEDYIDNLTGVGWYTAKTRDNNDPGQENYVDLEERAQIANDIEMAASGEVYFLSIHCNAGGSTGTETFYCNNTFNSNDNLLIQYAQSVQDNMAHFGDWLSRRCVEDYTYMNNDGVYYHLGVLKNLTMPNCLNEIGFVDSEDETKLLDNSWRNMFAFAYFEAFRESFTKLNVTSYNIVNMPNFGDGEYYTNINVTITNKWIESFTGDLRAMLRYLPLSNYDEPSQDFCQLGSNTYEFIPSGGNITVTFDSDIPYTDEKGLALCIESKENLGDGTEGEWTKVPMPSHRSILMFPINCAKISGVIYGNDYTPFQGAKIWSYQKPYKKSETEGSDTSNKSEPYLDTFDPTRCISNKNGEFELLIPVEWGSAYISATGTADYDDVSVDNIEDQSITIFPIPDVPPPPPESCNDGILNQDEEGIDCGGVCPSCGIGGNLEYIVYRSDYESDPDISDDWRLKFCKYDGTVSRMNGKKSHGVAGYSYFCEWFVLDCDNCALESCASHSRKRWEGDFSWANPLFYDEHFCGGTSLHIDCSNPTGTIVAESRPDNVTDETKSSGFFFEEDDFYFRNDRRYTLSFVCTNYSGEFDWEEWRMHIGLTNGLVQENFESKPIPELYYIGFLRDLSIKSKYVEVDFIPPNNNFSQLWVYIESIGHEDNKGVFFINFKLIEDCSEYVIYEDELPYYSIANEILIKNVNLIDEDARIVTAKTKICLMPSISILNTNFSALIDPNISCGIENKSEKSVNNKFLKNHLYQNDKSFNNHTIINIYPNPTKGTFNVEFTGGIENVVAIDIYSITGEKIETRTVGIMALNEFNTANWFYGIYLIRITTNDGFIVKRLVKE